MESVPRTPNEYRAWWEASTDVPYGTCWCGCGGKPSLAKYRDAFHGNVAGEPRRYLKGHHTRQAPVEYVEDPETGCWVWQLSMAGGYGGKHHKGKIVRAHRWYYEYWRGPIPTGLQLDHLCNNQACVNPEHLEIVTATENIRRRPYSRLNNEAAAEIRELYRAGEASQNALARRYGVSRTAIYDVIAGRTWLVE